MAQSKRIRVVSPEYEDLQEEPEEASREAAQTDDNDREEEFTEEGDQIDSRVTVRDVVAICDKLEIAVRSVVHYGISFRFRRDRYKRRDQLIKQIGNLRIAMVLGVDVGDPVLA